jgi:4-hydroxy-tetrahydrodipicolinate synthase
VNDLSGVHAILVTPFSPDGSNVDHPALEAHVERLVEAGVRLMVVGGNTSEYFSLTQQERTDAIRTVAAAAAGRATVIAGIGASIREAPAEGDAARRLGADGLMVHTPASPFITGQGWLRYLDTIAAAADAPLLPYLRSAAVDPASVATAATRPYAVAIKYAVADPLGFAQAVSRAPTETTWICGLAESWAPAFWSYGARGFTSGLVNLDPGLALGFWSALDRGDLAATQALWARIRPFESLRSRSGDGWNVAIVKAGMARTGHDVGPVREPSSELPDGLATELEAALRILVPSWDGS